jgi:hypothetical protein
MMMNMDTGLIRLLLLLLLLLLFMVTNFIQTTELRHRQDKNRIEQDQDHIQDKDETRYGNEVPSYRKRVDEAGMVAINATPCHAMTCYATPSTSSSSVQHTPPTPSNDRETMIDRPLI